MVNLRQVVYEIAYEIATCGHAVQWELIFAALVGPRPADAHVVPRVRRRWPEDGGVPLAEEGGHLRVGLGVGDRREKL